MRFALDDDHRDFDASIDALLAKSDLPAVVRSWAGGDTAPGLAVWRRLADLGVTGLVIDSDHGGVDATSIDLVVALERLGRWCVPGPVVESIAVAPYLLTGDSRLEQLASGDTLATVAAPPHVPRAVDASVCDIVLLVDDGIVSTGTVTASHASVDPARTLTDVTADQPIEVDAATVERALSAGTLGTAAQLLGAGHALLERTVEYASTRAQFGRAIGSFQAVKHHLADVAIALEMARPLVYGAAVTLDAGGADTVRDVSAAKVATSDAAYLASRAALQVHGAIGYTAEYDVSLWITRIRALVSAWGTPTAHRARVLEALR